MARKLNRNLVALGSAAIVSVYAVGYARTQGAAGQAMVSPARSAASLATVAPLQPGAAATVASAPPAISTSPLATAIARAIATASATPAPAPVHPVAASATATPPRSAQTATPGPLAAAAVTAYKDGTYGGSGSNRFGEISVDLSIQGGKIAAVQITHSTTYYPVSRIARLPQQVLDRQNGQVDLVTGATNSARAFRDAVTNALSQASAGRTASAAPATGTQG